MPAIDMPADFIARSTFELETNTQTFESPLTKNVQRVLLAGDRWNATYTLRRMKAS